MWSGVNSLENVPIVGGVAERSTGLLGWLVGVLGVGVFLAFSRSTLAFNRWRPWSRVRHLFESFLMVYRVE